MSTRRAFVAGATAWGTGFALPRVAMAATSMTDALRGLERRHGGRLGVGILSAAHGDVVGHRLDERFPFCSTFKMLAAACMLARVDRGEERLDRRVRYPRTALVAHSPMTSLHAGGDGMTLEAIARAAVTVSDNTAGNLLFASFDGPAGLTAYLRSIGDATTRSDRTEPTLNTAISGDPRDTTTPRAMIGTMRRLLRGDALSSASRGHLERWLAECRTGGARLRAGVPVGWRVGDKTGTGEHAATNDVAIIRPPDREPILVAAYYVDSPAPAKVRDAVLKDVARIVVAGR